MDVSGFSHASFLCDRLPFRSQYIQLPFLLSLLVSQIFLVFEDLSCFERYYQSVELNLVVLMITWIMALWEEKLRDFHTASYQGCLTSRWRTVGSINLDRLAKPGFVRALFLKVTLSLLHATLEERHTAHTEEVGPSEIHAPSSLSLSLPYLFLSIHPPNHCYHHGPMDIDYTFWAMIQYQVTYFHITTAVFTGSSCLAIP